VRNFQTNFDRSQRTFNIMFRIAATMIALTFVGIFLFWAFVGFTAVKAADEVEQKGLKAVIERIWCGPDNHCL